MDPSIWLSALLVLVFILIGGVFSGTEMALVNLRETQIKKIEESSARGAKIAKLVRDPNQFLSAVQIGVTVAGFLSSAYGASTIAPALTPMIESWGVSPSLASTLALIGLTLIISYLSLVFGELVPKRLAMQRAETVTRLAGPPLGAFARLMRPAIWLLSRSTNAVVRLLGGDPEAKTEEVSPEEVRSLVSSVEGIPEADRRILEDVFEAAERTVVEVMMPRTQVDFLDGELRIDEAIARIHELSHSRYPVIGEDSDDVLGFVHLRDLFRLRAQAQSDGTDPTVAQAARPLAALPGTVKVLDALGRMREEKLAMCLVVDEYGGTDGIVTLEDLLEEIVGEIYDEYDGSERPDVVDASGSQWVMDGGTILQEVEDTTGVALPDDGSFETVAGFVMDQLGRVPRVGESVSVPGATVTVLGMEGRRIASVRVTRRAEGAGETG